MPDSSLSVAEAVRDAMRTSQRARKDSQPIIETPHDLPAPEPHLPLRKLSAHQLHARKGAVPKPIILPSKQQRHNQVKGFNPTPVQPLPHVDNTTASSEHAFAGRDIRRPSKLPLGELEHQNITSQHAEQSPSRTEENERPPSSPLLPPPPSPGVYGGPGKTVRGSRSVGSGLRILRHRNSNVSSHRAFSGPALPEPPYSARPSMAIDHMRESYRSAMTTSSSFAHLSGVNTVRSSTTTGLSTNGSFFRGGGGDPWQSDDGERTDLDMSVEDAIGMYEDGFDSARESLDLRQNKSGPRQSFDVTARRAADRPGSRPRTQETAKRPNIAHRRSQSASLLLGIAKHARPGASPPPTDRAPSTAAPTGRVSLPNNPLASEPQPQSGLPASSPAGPPPGPVARDRYGFKKVSQYVTLPQYDAWDATYRAHLERRSAKWHALMRSFGLATDAPLRFPPKSDKIKRYVRKGIPPEFRGAAWFWYAGGPGKLKAEQGLYWELVEKVEKGLLADSDREHIERDLNRTFPDNVKFKPDPSTMMDAQAGAGGGGGHDTSSTTTPKKSSKRRSAGSESETPIVRALRRVLQAFAIHNPNIGYCQSLNFIAGLLLLFLDSDEEKAFVLLNIVTTTHLPGTHGVALEGANIDIAVLMSCINDALPGVWNKLDDKQQQQQHGIGLITSVGSGGALRLPTISLATTAWFMSLFVGTLPIECVLRVWDCLFFEGSKTLFRIALAIFKFAEPQILKVNDSMEIFQLVQTIPRSLLDVNALMDVCFRRRGGFGSVSQGLIEARREERRAVVRAGVITAGADEGALRRFRGRWRARTAK